MGRSNEIAAWSHANRIGSPGGAFQLPGWRLLQENKRVSRLFSVTTDSPAGCRYSEVDISAWRKWTSAQNVRRSGHQPAVHEPSRSRGHLKQDHFKRMQIAQAATIDVRYGDILHQDAIVSLANPARRVSLSFPTIL
jgi:hypothetical protein